MKKPYTISLLFWSEAAERRYIVKKLNKRFTAERNSLRAYLACTCRGIQCPCQDIHSTASVNAASIIGQEASKNEGYYFINR